nr:hypothetical protein [Streptomyces sp. CHD11]
MSHSGAVGPPGTTGCDRPAVDRGDGVHRAPGENRATTGKVVLKP